MSLRFDPSAGLIRVPVQVQGVERGTSGVFQFALDTGATATVVAWDVAVFLGYEPAASSERARVTTGNDLLYCPRVVLDEIEALGLARRRLPVVCHTLPPTAGVDGLLGLDFFRGTYLRIDLVRGLVEVRPHRA